MHIWGKGLAAGQVGSGSAFFSVIAGRVNVSPGRVGLGPRKVTRGQLWAQQRHWLFRISWQTKVETAIDTGIRVCGVPRRTLIQLGTSWPAVSSKLSFFVWQRIRGVVANYIIASHVRISKI